METKNYNDRKTKTEESIGRVVVNRSLDKYSEELTLLEYRLQDLINKLIDKFHNQILGMTLIGALQDEKQENEYEVWILVDDSTEGDTPKEILKENFNNIISALAKEIDQKIIIRIILLSELWQSFYLNNYIPSKSISLSKIIYDNGILTAIKLSELHKSFILNQFEKYIITYVLTGSVTLNNHSSESDVDVLIVIDDTELRLESKLEFEHKIKSAILNLGLETERITGINNKLNVKVFTLTDFWKYFRESNPVVLTFVRNGVPLYDRGMYMAWKRLLQMGEVKPSIEAMSMYLHMGDQLFEIVNTKLASIIIEDIYWATVTPTQAILMLYDVQAPSPQEITNLLTDIFVRKEKKLDIKHVQILDNVLKLRKELQHGFKKIITGKEIDLILADALTYIKKIKSLFHELLKQKEKEDLIYYYEETKKLLTKILLNKGLSIDTKLELDKLIEPDDATLNFIPGKYLKILKDLITYKINMDKNKTSDIQMHLANNKAPELLKYLAGLSK